MIAEVRKVPVEWHWTYSILNVPAAVCSRATCLLEMYRIQLVHDAGSS
jgi:hypothetical protein